jgi:hypothetical protein
LVYCNTGKCERDMEKCIARQVKYKGDQGRDALRCITKQRKYGGT